MVLPVDTYTEKVRYISSLWDSQNKAPVLDEQFSTKRTLPFDGRNIRIYNKRLLRAVHHSNHILSISRNILMGT